MNKIINFLKIYSFSQCMTSLTWMKIICSISTLWIYFLRNRLKWSQRPDLWSTYTSAFLDHLALVRSRRALPVCTESIICVHGHHYLCARTPLPVCTDTIICVHGQHYLFARTRTQLDTKNSNTALDDEF